MEVSLEEYNHPQRKEKKNHLIVKPRVNNSQSYPQTSKDLFIAKLFNMT